MLLRFSPSPGWFGRHRALDKLVTVMNSRLMTIYLWGNIAILPAAAAMSSDRTPGIFVGSVLDYEVFGFLLV